MAKAKESIVRDSSTREVGRNYTERRPDGKTEARHYTSYGNEYRGKTVSDDKGHSTFYGADGSSSSGK